MTKELLERASRDGRLVVTENIVDFSILHRDWAAAARSHGGLIFTNPRRFNRAATAYPGDLLAALRALLEDPPGLGPSAIWWL